MSLSHPWLLGLGALGLIIPVLIHLLMREQRKRKVVSSLHLIEEVVRTSKQRKRIRNWPLFLLRCLAVLLLAFLFGKPLISGLGGASSKEAIVFVLDSSASMRAMNGGASSWEKGLEQIRDALDEAHPQSQVAITTTGDDLPLAWMSVGEAKRKMTELNCGYGGERIGYAMQRAVSFLGQQGGRLPKVVHVVGDLQKESMKDLGELNLAENVVVRVSGLEARQGENRSLRIGTQGRGIFRQGRYDVVADGEQKLNVSDDDEELLVDGGGVLRKPYSAESVGWHSRVVSYGVEDSFGLDDVVYDSYYVRPPSTALFLEPYLSRAVYEQVTFFVSRALAPLSAGLDKQVDRGAISPFHSLVKSVNEGVQLIQKSDENVIIFVPGLRGISDELVDALRGHLEKGGGVVLFGGGEIDLVTWNGKLEELSPVVLEGQEDVPGPRTLARSSSRHPLWGSFSEANRRKLRRVPMKKRHRVQVVEGSRVLAKYSDGVPLIVERQVGKGRAIVVNTSMDRSWSDWARFSELFVPAMHLVANAALPGRGELIRNAQTQVQVSSIGGQVLKVPGATLGANVEVEGRSYLVSDDLEIKDLVIEKPGHFEVKTEDGEVVHLLSANVPEVESRFDFFSEQAALQVLEGRRMGVEENASRTSLRMQKSSSSVPWKILLLFLLLVLIVEPWVARKSNQAVIKS